jgi:hypothetical protein
MPPVDACSPGARLSIVADAGLQLSNPSALRSGALGTSLIPTDDKLGAKTPSVFSDSVRADIANLSFGRMKVEQHAKTISSAMLLTTKVFTHIFPLDTFVSSMIVSEVFRFGALAT